MYIKDKYHSTAHTSEKVNRSDQKMFFSVDKALLLSAVCIFTSSFSTAMNITRSSLLNQHNCKGTDNIIHNRKKCREIMRTAVMRESRRFIRDLGTDSNLREAIEQSTPCPSFPRNQKDTNILKVNTLSPYEKRLVCNNEKFPTCVYQAACLCNGCINPYNINDNYENSMVSELVELRLGVLEIGGETKTMTFGVGCTCAFPRYAPQNN